MKIEIYPRTLLHLENICEVLYKLHPYVLDYLVDMQRSLGSVLGMIDLKNPSLEEREFIIDFNNSSFKKVEEILNNPSFRKKDVQRFYDLRKYLQLDTDEYVPIKIFVEIEDPVVGRKVKELVRALEQTRAIEQFLYNKKEIDEDAYFAEGYGIRMNEEQKKKLNDYLDSKDDNVVEELLIKEKLYP